MLTVDKKETNIQWRPEIYGKRLTIHIIVNDIKLPVNAVITKWAELYYTELKKKLSSNVSNINEIRFSIECPEMRIDQLDDFISNLKDAQTIKNFVSRMYDCDDEFEEVIPGFILGVDTDMTNMLLSVSEDDC